MSSKIAFIPITQTEKSIFNFKALSETTNAWVESLAKGLAELSVHDEASIKSFIVSSVESSFSGGKKIRKTKVASDIKHPKTAYIFFCSDKRAQVKSENPSMTSKEITSELAKMWGDIDQESKAKYEEMHKADKARYEAEKAASSSSDASEASEGEEEKKEAKPKKAPAKAKKTASETEASETEAEAKPKKVVAKAAVPPPPPAAELISKPFDEGEASKFLKLKTIAEIVTFLRQKSQKPEFHLPKYNKNTKATVMTDALGIMLELDVCSF